ncbi:hypothetical protein K7X08_012271 [Anisodus acutangulus]|uniref:Uncharacterized protein n=1 Tax=Anisodus acutangulus TaxID=402998 RepID=A0A9Q1L9Z7_9SOLA|nr:hypothetical protein K7X08_012271 [Anisodus acutangulus]
MDQFDEISVPTSPKTPTKNDQMEPGVLLEESWFFGNLLDRKSRMLRCYSDPCPSFKISQDNLAGKSMEETFSSLQKLPQGEKFNLDSRRSKPRLQRASSSSSSSHSSNLKRAPSLPVFVDYKEEPHDEESDFSMGKLIRQASINQVKISPQKQTSKSNLQRVPSLTVFQESEQIHDEESDFSMGKLIRQASINKVKISPPKHTSQVNLLKASKSNLQRAPSLPAFAKMEEIHEEENEFSMGKLIRQASLNHARVLPPKHTSKGLTRSPSISSSTTNHHLRRKQDQESQLRNSSNGLEVEDFKNLDLNNEKKDSIAKFADTSTPGVKEKNKKKPDGLSELEKIRRPPYSPEDHMKEQIKFWARAVASNVR